MCVTDTLNVCPQAKVKMLLRLISGLGLAGHISHYSTKLFWLIVCPRIRDW